MKIAYVTGIYGMLGSAIARTLSVDWHVAGCDIVPRPMGMEYQADNLDLTDFALTRETIQKLRPNVIIHTAAIIDVDKCETHPEIAIMVNAEATRNLAQVAKDTGSRFVYISTDAVFDGEKNGAYVEDDVPNPANVYGASKLEGERYSMMASCHNLVLRTNIYGWNLQKKQSFAEWVYCNLANGTKIRMFTDVKYSPIYVFELSRLIRSLLSTDASGVFHAVGAESCSKYEFGIRLARLFHLDENLILPASYKDFSGFKAKRVGNMRLDSKKLASFLGRAMQSISEGLLEFGRDRENFPGAMEGK